MKKYNYLVCFDLDRTIIPYDSGTELALFANKKGLIRVLDFLAALLWFVLYLLRLISATFMLKQLVKWTSGVSLGTLAKLNAELFQHKLKTSIYLQIYTEIEMHRKNNAEIVIISSSIAEICELFVSHLKIDGAISTQLAVQNNLLTGKTVGNFCYHTEKKTRLVDYCMQNNYPLNEVYFYSDSFSDLPAMNTVGFPVAVNPDKKLLAWAKKHNWKTYNWQ